MLHKLSKRKFLKEKKKKDKKPLSSSFILLWRRHESLPSFSVPVNCFVQEIDRSTVLHFSFDSFSHVNHPLKNIIGHRDTKKAPGERNTGLEFSCVSKQIKRHLLLRKTRSCSLIENQEGVTS